MLRRPIAGLGIATMSALTLFCAFFWGLAGPQEKSKDRPPPAENANPHEEAAAQNRARCRET